MKKLFVLLLSIALLPVVFAQTPSLNWINVYTSSNAYAVATDSSDNVISTGEDTSTDPNGDYMSIKFDSAGNQICIANSGSANTDEAYGIDTDSSGNFTITGSWNNGASWRTFKYNTTCGEIWNVTATGNGGYAVAVDALNNIIVVGDNTGGRPRAIKYDSNGNFLYDINITNQNGRFYGVTVDSQNNIIATGYQDSASYMIVHKFNTTLGPTWNRSFSYSKNTWNKNDIGQDVETDSSDNIYVVGIYNTSYDVKPLASPEAINRILVVKYNSAGTQQWNTTFDTTNSSLDGAGGFGIAIDNTDKIYITGFQQRSTNYWEFITHRINNDGSLNWSTNYSLGGQTTDSAYGADTDSAGRINIAGQGTFVTLQYNNNEPSPTGLVPEFSITTLLLAVLIAGGLIFAIRKHR